MLTEPALITLGLFQGFTECKTLQFYNNYYGGYAHLFACIHRAEMVMQKFCLEIQRPLHETPESLKRVKMHVWSTHVTHCLLLPVIHICMYMHLSPNK